MAGDRPARYDIRKDGYDTWEIFDTLTGRTVSVGGKPRAGLKLDEADVLVDMLNSGDQEPDEETEH
ncbi:hypothetical protein SAMN02982989_3383 [Xaviernesmea oryzae]|uniref:Uncharacterized protein n=1 Tax=Xaviernesmea oryzae TaxID=464029 RepID=A0A1X7G824_9HYPH|nr:hypothetical protein [Xaviernesmea oryzae]SMF65623.1 hypothetical protein SAMN02982989_3383 [Xaviernesmea oryzae]